MSKILWNSIKPPLRYFWVPVGENVFKGEYQIENGDGDEEGVDLESLIPFEITGEEAEAIMMSELEDMTNELGGLFKGIFNLGKRMINSELMDEDSEDWDSEEDSDSEYSSEEDSDSEDEDSDFDEDDLDKVISLFDLDSEDDSDEDSDSDEGTLEDLLSQFGDDLEGPLTELRDLIVKEVGNLGEELDKLGSQAAKELDAEPGAGQDILRELGQWLINLAEEQDQGQEQEQEDEEDVVVMEFKPKADNTDNEGQDSNQDDIKAKTTSEVPTDEDSSEPTTADSEEHVEAKDSSEASDSENALTDDATESSNTMATEENQPENVVSESNTDTDQHSPELPSSSNLKRMTKAQLIELGTTFGLTLSMKDTKNTLLEQLETLR